MVTELSQVQKLNFEFYKKFKNQIIQLYEIMNRKGISIEVVAQIHNIKLGIPSDSVITLLMRKEMVDGNQIDVEKNKIVLSLILKLSGDKISEDDFLNLYEFKQYQHIMNNFLSSLRNGLNLPEPEKVLYLEAREVSQFINNYFSVLENAPEVLLMNYPSLFD